MNSGAFSRPVAQWALRAAAIGAMVAHAAGPSAAETAAGPAIEAVRSPTWALRLPSVDKVVFRGSVSHDAAGLGNGTFVYPAPGAVGLLAAVLTHGAITYGARQRQKDQMQQEADQVLAPYEPVLAGFTNRQLMEAGLRQLRAGSTLRLLGVTEPAEREPLIETAPVFSLTQDQRALVLDNIVRIFAAGRGEPVYVQTIRVVSRPLALPVEAGSGANDGAPAAVVALWLDAQGRHLIDQSAALFAESIDIALADSAGAWGDPGAPQKTFRYAEGGRERMERAQFVAERCGDTVIRTLRGGLMAVPPSNAVADAPSPCAAGERRD